MLPHYTKERHGSRSENTVAYLHSTTAMVLNNILPWETSPILNMSKWTFQQWIKRYQETDALKIWDVELLIIQTANTIPFTKLLSRYCLETLVIGYHWYSVFKYKALTTPGGGSHAYSVTLGSLGSYQVGGGRGHELNMKRQR